MLKLRSKQLCHTVCFLIIDEGGSDWCTVHRSSQLWGLWQVPNAASAAQSLGSPQLVQLSGVRLRLSKTHCINISRRFQYQQDASRSGSLQKQATAGGILPSPHLNDTDLIGLHQQFAKLSGDEQLPLLWYCGKEA